METTTQPELFIKMVIDEWNKQNKNFDKLLSVLTELQLSKEIAPGKNTGVYLTGHLVAISDAMLPLLGLADKLFPQLENIFIRNPDKSGLEKPSVGYLKECLQAVNDKLTQHFHSMQPAEWFERHMAVSEEDFVKEPHRNKLNVVINRSNHMSYHLGQLALLK
jgi:hypothetical protein